MAKPTNHARDHWAGGSDPSAGPWVDLDLQDFWAGSMRIRFDGVGDTEIDGDLEGDAYFDPVAYAPQQYWPTTDKTRLGAVLASGSFYPVTLAALDGAITIGGPMPAYQDYTPTWTSSGTAPAIGNATVVGRYVEFGKLVHCRGAITFGNTSTFGTGDYAFALPVPAASYGNTDPLGTATLYDNNTGNFYIAAVARLTSTTMRIEYPATYGGAWTFAGATAPWTWDDPDVIGWSFVYEAA